jgi:hypothetical protein
MKGTLTLELKSQHYSNIAVQKRANQPNEKTNYGTSQEHGLQNIRARDRQIALKQRNKTRLEDRIYECKYCGLVIDRDLNAAINILNEGLEFLQQKQRVPVVRQLGRRELRTTPADTVASTSSLLEYLNSIPYVKASMVEETGSPISQRVVVQSSLVEKPTIFSRG